MFARTNTVSLSFLVLLAKLSPLDTAGPTAVLAYVYPSYQWATCHNDLNPNEVYCKGHVQGAQTEDCDLCSSGFGGPCTCIVSHPVSNSCTLLKALEDYCPTHDSCPGSCQSEVRIPPSIVYRRQSVITTINPSGQYSTQYGYCSGGG